MTILQKKNSIIFKNWNLNKNYIYKIKKIARFLLNQIFYFLNIKTLNNKIILKKAIFFNISALISLFDKSLKKHIYKLNFVNRRKKKIIKLYTLLNK